MDPHERRWPATLAVATVLVLQLTLPGRVSIGPGWLLPVVQALLLAPVAAANPLSLTNDHRALRIMAAASAVGVMVFAAVTLANLVHQLASGVTLRPSLLITSAVVLLVTDVVACSVLLWELDCGGPFARDPGHDRTPGRPDLLFPQMTGVPGWDADRWRPGFADYLFVGFTMATAFSPTDTMPLSARAKLVFMVGASISVVTIAVVAARAVNIL